jgi:transcriptional regulator NrdR family protein
MIIMRCPYCDSDNYHYIEAADFDESDTVLLFKCLGKCGREFGARYSFLCYEDEDGNEIDGEY